MKNFAKKLLNNLSLLLVASLVFGAFPFSEAVAQTTPARLSFTPTSQNLGTGRTGTVNAFLNPGGAGVASVELVITYNPSIINVTNITPGAFFNSTAGAPVEIIKNINNTTGRIHYAIGFPLGSGRSSTAQNAVANISFTTRVAGTNTFTYVTTGSPSTRVANLNAVNVLGGVTGGSVVVSASGSTATPTRVPTGTVRPTNTPTRAPTGTVRPTNTPTRTPSPSGTISGAVLSFAPTSQTVNGVNRTGTINAFLAPNGRPVASAELVITYNPNIVRVTNIAPGAFFTSSAGSPVEIIKNIDNTAGRIHYAIGFPLGSGQSSATSNNVAIISFTSVGAGTSAFTYVTQSTTGSPTTKVSNLSAQNVLAQVGNGSVVVTGSATVTPTRTGTGTPTRTATNTPTIRISGTVTPTPTGTQQGSRLSFAPTSQTVNGTNQAGTANVHIDPRQENVSSIELVITYNPQVIRVDNITPGAFFTSSGAGTPVEIVKNISNGRIHYAVAFPLGSGFFSTTPNVAAQISFTSLSNGVSPLTFTTSGAPSTQVSDVNARNVLGSVSVGSIVVGGLDITGTPSPTPPIGEICYETDPKGTPTPSGSPVPTKPEIDDDDEEDEEDDDGDDDGDDDEKPIVNLTVSGSTIRWSTQNAVFCNGFAGTTNWRGSRGTSGTFTVTNLQTTTTFGLICGSEREDETDRDFRDDDDDETVAEIKVNAVSEGETVDFELASVLATSTTNQWTNVPLGTQTGEYSVTFSATPREINDHYIGTSNGPAQTFTDLVSIIHFTHNGTIVARDDIQYAATSIVRYSGGQTYDFRLVVDSANKTYSAYVAPRGGTYQEFAKDYSFRTEQLNTESINNLAMFSRTTNNGVKVCNIEVDSGTEGPTPTQRPPTPTNPAGSSPTPTPIACVPNNGDANGDGVVDGNDFDIWSENYLQSTVDGPSAGDFNCSRFVDGVDYVIWLINTISGLNNPA